MIVGRPDCRDTWVRLSLPKTQTRSVRERLRELVAELRRFGYRGLSWLLARQGHMANREKCYHTYAEEKLIQGRGFD